MRWIQSACRAVVLLLATLGLFAGDGSGQAGDPGALGLGPWSAGLFAGLGEGPSPTLMYGVGVHRALTPAAGLSGEFGRWIGGAGVDCAQAWPDSYACSLRGVSLMVGGFLEPWRGRSLSPALEVGVGLFDRTDRVGEGRPSPAGSATLALRVDPGGWGSVRAFARRTVVADDGYARLMDEDLRFWSVGLEWAIHPARPTPARPSP